jgi:hypothetical protein
MIGPRSFQYVHLLLGEPMTVPVVDAIVLLRFSELIHDFACFGVLAMFRNVERLRVSFV